MAVTNNTININLSKPSGFGAFHPKVGIDSISLYPSADIAKSKQDPHINHPDEISVATNLQLGLNQMMMPMEVVLDLFVLLPIENNTYLSVLFDDEIIEYLHVGVVQCMNKDIHQNISADYYKYLNPVDGLVPKESTDTIKKYTEFRAGGKFFKFLPDVVKTALEKENGSQDFVDIGIQTDLPYEKVTLGSGNVYYKIPFKRKMMVPATAGGINPDFLSYYVFTYFDVDKLKNSLDIGGTGYNINVDLSGPLMKNLTFGTIDTDVVISNGLLNDKTYAYKYASTIPSGLSQLEIQMISSAMADKAGQWYWGPVHQMPNGLWMTGESHNAYNSYGTQTMSLPLEKVAIPNAKVKDFRQKAELESFNFDFNQTSQYFTNDQAILKLANNGDALTKFLFSKKKPNFFTEMYMSRDVYGANRFMFGINMPEIILSNSMFGDMLLNLASNDLLKYQSILADIKISSLKIFRKKTKTAQVIQSDLTKTTFSKQDFEEMIVHSSDSSSNKLQQLTYNPALEQGVEDFYKPEVSATISELILESVGTGTTGGIRTFSGVDYSVGRKMAGTYQYRVELEIKDPSVEYLKGKSNSLKNMLEGTQGWAEYMNDMSKPSYSNPYTDRFTVQAFKQFLQKYPQNYIGLAVQKYIDVLYELGTKTTPDLNDQRLKYFNFLCSISSPNTGSIDGVILFYNLVNDLIQKLDKIIASASGYVKLKQVSSAVDPHVENNPNIVANTKPRTFKISHTFKSLYNAEIPSGYGLDFLSPTLGDNTAGNSFIPNGLKVYTITDMQNRFDLETKKLFGDTVEGIQGGTIQIKTENNIGQGGNVLNPNDSVVTTKFSFLSPSVINLPRQQPFFSLAESNNSNPEKYAETFLDMYGSTQTSPNAFDIGLRYIPQRNTSAREQASIELSNTEKERRYDLNRIFAEKGCTLEIKTSPPLDASPFNILSGFFDGGNNVAIDDLVAGNVEEYILDTNINTNKMLSMLLYIDDFNLLPSTDPAENIFGNSINSAAFYNVKSDQQGKTFKNEYAAATFNNPDPGPPPLVFAPNHIKALLLSFFDQSITNDNIVKKLAEKNQDPFKDANAFPFIQLNYKTINRIEVFRGFKDGNLKDPIFTDMVAEDVLNTSGNNLILCRQKRYYNPTYGVVKSSNMDLPTFDEYFFLSKQQELAPASEAPPPVSTLPSARNPLTDAVKMRGRFFESAGPDLVMPEFIQSGLLETPKIDNGLTDPVMRKGFSDEVKRSTLGRTVGQNMQRLKDKGLGYLLEGMDLGNKNSNTTAAGKNGIPVQKSILMKNGIADQSAPMGTPNPSGGGGTY